MQRLAVITFIFSLLNIFSFGQELSVEKIWKEYAFYGKSVDGFRSMKNGNYFTKVNHTDTGTTVTKHSFKNYTGKNETLITSDMLKGIRMDDYFFNNEETKVLISTETEYIYRHSFLASYFLLDLTTGKLEPLDTKHQPQMLAEYSPDGKKVSYIYDNNLFVKDLESGKIKQITKYGTQNAIIYGATDWVYEEEFGFTKAYGWSPDSKYLSYLRFIEVDVPEFTMTYFHDLYPQLYTFKYPKAGEDNSIVTAHIVKATGGKAKEIDLGDYEYIPRMKWSATENKLIIQTLNRHQNHVKYHLISMNKSKLTSRVFFEEKSTTYVEIDDNLLILKDGKTILRTSEADGYNHIYKIDFDGKSTQVTEGEWDVIEFLGVDDDNSTIYYSSAENGPIYKGIHKMNLADKKSKLISSSTGYNEAQFSNGMKYFIKTYSTANTPPVYSLCDNEGVELTILEDNKELIDQLSTYKLATKEFITFEGHQTNLNGYIMKPHDFDPAKKYPVYINIYGGPGANTVSDSWGSFNYMFFQLLTQKGYIVVSVDPRGTMYRGAEFKKSTYLQLGKLETEDFIAVAKELQTYSFVDKDRIGIQGWSYGGFMTSLAMTKGADYFKMGIAVAPVTNWRYYDNIYTERFMRTPAENESGYDDNSPINFVNKLKGNYLLIHGSGDDNVHYQNTMEMINAMVAADKQFDLFIYPNKNHSIYGGNTRNHLFTMILNYTLINL